MKKRVMRLVWGMSLCLVSSLGFADEDLPPIKVLSEPSVETTSRPLFDPGITPENASQFQTSDGSSTGAISADPIHKIPMAYSRPAQDPEMVKLNQISEAFYRDEQARRKAFKDKLRRSKLTDEQIQKKLAAYRRDEQRKRKQFIQSQQEKSQAILCKGSKSPGCENKPSFMKRLLALGKKDSSELETALSGAAENIEESLLA